MASTSVVTDGEHAIDASLVRGCSKPTEDTLTMYTSTLGAVTFRFATKALRDTFWLLLIGKM